MQDAAREAAAQRANSYLRLHTHSKKKQQRRRRNSQEPAPTATQRPASASTSRKPFAATTKPTRSQPTKDVRDALGATAPAFSGAPSNPIALATRVRVLVMRAWRECVWVWQLTYSMLVRQLATSSRGEAGDSSASYTATAKSTHQRATSQELRAFSEPFAWVSVWSMAVSVELTPCVGCASCRRVCCRRHRRHRRVPAPD